MCRPEHQSVISDESYNRCPLFLTWYHYCSRREIKVSELQLLSLFGEAKTSTHADFEAGVTRCTATCEVIKDKWDNLLD